MLIAARNAMMVKGGYTARDYVQDGLIAMWDGIENAGWGVHDSKKRAIDLVGQHPNISGFSSMTDNAMVFNRGDYCQFNAGDWVDYRAAVNTGNFAFEFCGILLNQRGWSTIIHAYYNNNNSRFNVRPCMNRDNTANYRRIQAFVISSAGNPGLRIDNTYPQIIPSDLEFGNITVSSKSNGQGAVYCDDNHYDFSGGVFPIEANALDLCFGREAPTGPEGNSGNGNWHCIRWYSKFLTPNEAAHNRAIDKARFNLP